MNVVSIVAQFLDDNGFDGLYNVDGGCACLLKDLAPCGELNCDCEPGYKCPCDCETQFCGFHVSAKKTEATKPALPEKEG